MILSFNLNLVQKRYKKKKKSRNINRKNCNRSRKLSRRESNRDTCIGQGLPKQRRSDYHFDEVGKTAFGAKKLVIYN